MITQSKKVEGMGFQDLKSFNFAMLTKQGWRLLQNKGSLVHQCTSAPVPNLMDPESRCWNKEVIMAKFHRDDVEAILCIPLSTREIMDFVMWLHTTSGMYLVKSGYHVAAQVLRDVD